tara:strand:+ start:588 stop:1250 length:663 start_codon:yes stop_codon:yes gene_type:complete
LLVNKTNLIIALTKGRILEETLPLFERAGIVPNESLKKSRKLLFDTNIKNVQFMLLRGSDVATYVEFGSADMGVVGKDLILEHGSEGFYEPLDLGIAKCRLMTAVRSDRNVVSGRITVATKYMNIAKEFFANQGKQIELIKLNGALELAPALGLADAIVDIVDTGETLKANGLEPQHLIADISSRIIVNKASMKIKHRIVSKILEQLNTVVKNGKSDPGK